MRASATSAPQFPDASENADENVVEYIGMVFGDIALDASESGQEVATKLCIALGRFMQKTVVKEELKENEESSGNLPKTEEAIGDVDLGPSCSRRRLHD